MDTPTLPRFPVYIPSKSRATIALTPGVLERMGVPHFIIVEEHQWAEYREAFGADRLLILPKEYQEEYETCDDLGGEKSRGPGPARNFAWEHSKEAGHPWHWVMDDNIQLFARLHQNQRIPVATGMIFHAMETFALRYVNVAMAGPNYWMFATSRARQPPFVTGTRIYSCNLIRNDLPFRWRGRYNEDTILSLDMLKAGWMTVQFNAFLQHKTTTQVLGGGNTEEFYAKEGTLPKSRMLVNVHPDVARLARRFNRDHHHVDYGQWLGQPLVPKPAADQPPMFDYRLTIKPKTTTM
jgi:hypothetical protein